MCAIQLPAFVSVLLLLVRGRYHDHIFLFWFIIASSVLGSWLWSVVRTGRHVRPQDVGVEEGKMAFAPRSFLYEFASSTVAVISIVASLVGIVLSFL